MITYSQRLSYTKFNNNDYQDYCKWYCDDVVMKYITGAGLSPDEARKRFLAVMRINEQHTDFGLFLVRLRKSQEYVGIAKFTLEHSFQAEVGYGLFPEYWRQGYGSEILEDLIQKAETDANITQLLAIVSTANIASIRMLDAHGFIPQKVISSDDDALHYIKNIREQKLRTS